MFRMNKSCYLVILILLSFSISLSLGQSIPLNITTFYPPQFTSPIGYQDEIGASQAFFSTAYESLFFDEYEALELNSILITNNCAAIPAGYTLLPAGGIIVGFNIIFNDTKSIINGSLSISGFSSGNPIGLLLCTTLSNDLIFFEGYLPNPDGSYSFPNIIYNGIYSLVSYNSTIPPIKNILFGQNLIISPIVPAIYQFQNGFSINATANSTIMVTVQFYTTNPTGIDPPGKISCEQFVDIETQDEIDYQIVGLQASLTFTYTTNYPNFAIGHYDDSTNAWSFSTIPPIVNTTAKTVTQNTTHFSTWGLYGETATATSLSPLYLFSITLIIVLVFII